MTPEPKIPETREEEVVDVVLQTLADEWASEAEWEDLEEDWTELDEGAAKRED